MNSIRAWVGGASWPLPAGLGHLAYDLANELSGARKPRILISQIYDRPGSGGPHDDTSPEHAVECVAELADVDLALRMCDLVDVQNDAIVGRVGYPGHFPISHAGPDRLELWSGSLTLLRDTPDHRVPFRSVIYPGSEFVQAEIAGGIGLVVMRAVGPDDQTADVLEEVREYAAAPRAVDQMDEWYRVERGAEHDAPELLAVCGQGVVTAASVQSEHRVVPHIRIERTEVSLREHYRDLIEVLATVFGQAVEQHLPVRWGLEFTDGS